MRNCLVLILIIIGFNATTQSINDLPLQLKNDTIQFAFAGHTYGRLTASVHPCPSLYNGLDTLNHLGLDFTIFLGDIIKHQEQIQVELLKKNVLSKLKHPVFNAIGNHDLSHHETPNQSTINYTFYRKHFTSKTWFHFGNQNNRFIILDSEIDSLQIIGEQKAFLIHLIDSLTQAKSLPLNWFIFTHKELPFYKGNWSTEIIPLLQATNGNIYHLSGDCEQLSPLCYHYIDSTNQVHYIQAHLQDVKDDGFIHTTILPSGEVTFDFVPLNYNDFNQIEIPFEKPIGFEGHAQLLKEKKTNHKAPTVFSKKKLLLIL